MVIVYGAPDPPEDEDTEVWYLESTNEYFTSYDEYLKRMDYYHERYFICELSGKTHLTYFEAAESEAKEAQSIVQKFPEPLKEPILRKVQQSTITRLDVLVDSLYQGLRHDFFPGESVIYKEHQRMKVIIREKAQFAEVVLPNGERRPAFARYRVESADDPKQEMVVVDTDLIRDRRTFTKITLRTFVRHAVVRGSKGSGCPWTVKPEYAAQYRIDTSSSLTITPSGNPRSIAPAGGAGRSSSAKPASKGYDVVNEEKKTNMSLTDITQSNTPVNGQYGVQLAMTLTPDGALLPPTFGSVANGIQPSPTPPVGAIDGVNAATPQPGQRGRRKRGGRGYSDLDDDFAPNIYDPASEALRPALKREAKLWALGQDYTLMGPLLEIWLFMNMYQEPLVLDPFTFDDLLRALVYYDLEENDCLLLSEIHCALLSLIVGTKNNQLLVQFPENSEEEPRADTESVPDDDTDVEMKDEPEGEASESKKEGTEDEEENEGRNDEDAGADKEDEIEGEEKEDKSKKKRNATTSSTYANYQNVSWTERLRKRMFRDGGWQQILIGLFHSIQDVSEWKYTVAKVLAIMATRERSVTLSSARQGYCELGFDLKIKVLEILCQLAFTSPSVRSHIDQSIDEVTRLRKERTDLAREQKQIVDVAKHAKINLEKANTQNDGDADEEEEEEVENNPTTNATNNTDETATENDTENKPENTELVQKYGQLKHQIADLDKLILQKDCQRLHMLGRDRYFNRYWWFEHNGVEAEDEGYGMGRLWVQGPSPEEIRVYLNDEIDSSGYVKKLKLEHPGAATNGTSQGNGKAEPYQTLYDRKLKADGIYGENDWAYYDTEQEIESLVSWLNENGRREAGLVKELNRCKDNIIRSIKVRQEELEEDEANIKKEIDETILNEFGPSDEEAQENEGQDKDERNQEEKEKDGDSDSDTAARRRRGRPRRQVKDDKKQRAESIMKRRQELAEEFAAKMPERVMEWTNSAAEREFGQSHYESNRQNKRTSTKK